ncbi:glutamine synthetase cytosolic isozyme 1-1 [Tanacetum coccineum]
MSFIPLWEFHVRPSLGIASGDELWAARYILEIAKVVVSFYRKPIPIDWNGVGARTNYSTKSMREEGGYEIIKIAIGRHETADINTFKWVDGKWRWSLTYT